MLFNSFHFLVFFPIALLLYFNTPAKYRHFVLLASSYYFYMAVNIAYGFLLLAGTLVNFTAALWLEKTAEMIARKLILTVSVAINISILWLFKTSSIHFSNYLIAGAIPIGISFHTLQTIGYLIDIYRKERAAEKNLYYFALFVCFYPQLVAGPIERSKNLLPQLHKDFNFDYTRLYQGLRTMLWGFMLKLIIADRLGIFVDHVYKNIHGASNIDLLTATYFFAFQIYGDFAGYTLIAIGSAHIMGYDLMQNFKSPYLADSIQDFWHRWHISLSTWFRDYLYLPLGGNRVSRLQWAINIMIVFLVSGIWHGIHLTYLVWGTLHAAFLIITVWRRSWWEKLGIFKVFITFHLVLIAWVFFRATSLTDAWYVLTHMFCLSNLRGINVAFKNFDQIQLMLSLAVIAILIIIESTNVRSKWEEFLDKSHRAITWPFYILMVLVVLWLGIFNETRFIYYAF